MKKYKPSPEQVWQTAEAREEGDYFIARRSFYRVMSKLDALFLQDLINLSNCSTRDGDWFLCTTTYLMKKGWTPKEARTRLESLSGKQTATSGPRTAFVSTELRPGRPSPVRWVRVNTAEIESRLTQTRPNGQVQTSPNGHPTNDVFQTSTKKEEADSPKPESAAPRSLDFFEESYLGIPRRNKVLNNPTPRKKESTPPSKKKGVAMPFDLGTQPVVSTNGYRLTEFDLGCARRLRAYVKSQKWSGSSSRKKWADQIRLLRTHKGKTEAEIASVLDFLIGDKVTYPKITDCKQLLDQFEWVKGLRDKKLPDVVVSPQARKINDAVSAWNWPPAVRGQLPAMIQVSLTNFERFAAGLDRAAASPPTPVSRMAKAIRSGIYDQTHFVRVWFEDLGRWWASAPEFKGNPSAWVMSAGHKNFSKLFSKDVLACGGQAVWEKLLKEVGGAEAAKEG